MLSNLSFRSLLWDRWKLGAPSDHITILDIDKTVGHSLPLIGDAEVRRTPAVVHCRNISRLFLNLMFSLVCQKICVLNGIKRDTADGTVVI